MSKELYIWLEKEWRISNHVKYYKYFDEWANNLTLNQIIGFENAMNSINIILK